MPKKKVFKLPLNYKEDLGNISEIFGLSVKEMDDLMLRFHENLKTIAKIKPHFKMAEVAEAAASAATSDTELAYVFFRVGRLHEQQNMEQAAAFAERVIIPALTKIPQNNRLKN